MTLQKVKLNLPKIKIKYKNIFGIKLVIYIVICTYTTPTEIDLSHTIYHDSIKSFTCTHHADITKNSTNNS